MPTTFDTLSIMHLKMLSDLLVDCVCMELDTEKLQMVAQCVCAPSIPRTLSILGETSYSRA